MTLGLQSLKLNRYEIPRIQRTLILAPSPPHLSIGRRRHPQWSPPPLRDVERQPGLGLAAHLLLQPTMMNLQILIQILKLQVKKVRNAASARSVHRWSNGRYAGRVHDIFQSNGQQGRHDADFCTQRCLLGLQQGGLLDDACPNVMLHKKSRDGMRHAINSTTLVQRLKKQLDKNIDHNCTPMGNCGASGAPFKVTYAKYGYTVVGKGTTTLRWPELQCEAEVYRILQQAQGSAVPVFLGEIDLAIFYTPPHGAGKIRYMLLMGWGGNSIGSIENAPSCAEFTEEELNREISRSVKKIRSLGVLHEDLRPDNILWNAELRRALIIDFHWARLDRRPKRKRLLSCRAEARQPKRHHTIC